MNSVVNSKNVFPLWYSWSCPIVDQNYGATGFYYSRNPLEYSTEHFKDVPPVTAYPWEKADEQNDLDNQIDSTELPAHESACDVRALRGKR